MPYPEGHKLKVRKLIITSAAKAFRTNGVRNISLPYIMKGAGLTHGGFYSHFENKEQLVIEACHFAISDTIEILQKVADKNEEQPQIQTVIEFYLSSVHRDQTEIGCILPTLSGEVSQLSEEVRQAYTHELQRFMKFMSDMAGVDASTGYALVSSMVGTLALAGKAQAKRIIEAAFYSS